MNLVLNLAERIQHSDVGTNLAGSLYAFPVIEAIHLVGLAFSIGLLLFVDFRLLGWFLADVPLGRLLRPLRPWVLAGFVVTFISGGLLFWSEAASIVVNPAFQAKLVFIVLAGGNALYFEFVALRRLEEGDPLYYARIPGALSLALWVLVIGAGRLIPYVA